MGTITRAEFIRFILAWSVFWVAIGMGICHIFVINRPILQYLIPPSIIGAFIASFVVSERRRKQQQLTLTVFWGLFWNLYFIPFLFVNADPMPQDITNFVGIFLTIFSPLISGIPAAGIAFLGSCIPLLKLPEDV